MRLKGESELYYAYINEDYISSRFSDYNLCCFFTEDYTRHYVKNVKGSIFGKTVPFVLPIVVYRAEKDTVIDYLTGEYYYIGENKEDNKYGMLNVTLQGKIDLDFYQECIECIFSEGIADYKRTISNIRKAVYMDKYNQREMLKRNLKVC